jgi:hypothetical protein
MVPIHVYPSLHESSAAAQGACDRWGIVTFEGQKNSSIAVSLLGIPLLTAPFVQLCQVLRMV